MKIFQFITGPIAVNTYIVLDEQSRKGFIVDPGAPSIKILNCINENSIELEYIILTHGHGDHIGGVSDIVNHFPKVKIIANKKEEEMLLNANLNSSAEIFGYDITINPDILVVDGDQIKVGDIELKFISTPGHTKGGMCIKAENVLFSGDTLFRYSIGRTDFYGGDFDQLMRSIKNKLFMLPDDTLVLPGHEDRTTIGDEKKGNPFV